MNDEWPMMARDDEFGRLRRLLRAEHGIGAVIVGAPGVGKTRLAGEAANAISRGGARIVYVTGSDALAGTALGALAPVVLADGSPLDGGAPSRWHCFQAILGGSPTGRPLLVVDDAHAIDDESAGIVYDIAASGRAQVILTLRPDVRAPDPIRRLWKDHGVPRIDLHPLSEDDTLRLMEAALGGTVESSSASHFYRSSGGNVLFLRELVSAALNDEALERDSAGLWHLTAAAPVSARLAEIVTSLLGPVGTVDRDILELIAYADPAGRGEMDQLGDMDAAADLERRGLLRSTRDGRRLAVSLAHPIYAEVLRQRMPTTRRSALARRLAENVEARGARRADDHVRIATWRLDCGDCTPQSLLEAAVTARWRFDLPLAERLAHTSWQAGGGFDAGLLCGQLAELQGRPREAETWFAAVDPLACHDDQIGQLATVRLETWAYGIGSLADGLRVATEAEGALTDPDWRDEIASRKLPLTLAAYGPRASAEAAEALAARSTDRTHAWACLEAAYGLGRLGRVVAATRFADRGLHAHLALTQSFEWSPWMHRLIQCDILAHGGTLAAAENLAETHPNIANGDLETRAFFALHLAKVVGDRGHITCAIDNAEVAIALFRRLGRQQMIQMGLTYLALAHALAGNAENSTNALSEAESATTSRTYMTGIDLDNARAWTTASAGRIPEARDQLERAAATGARIGDHVGEAFALHSIARLGDPHRCIGRLADLASHVDGQLAPARAKHAEMLIARSAPGLLDVSKEFQAMGADLLAAEASADAAVAWRYAGNTPSAADAEHRAEALAQLCDGASTPPLHGTDIRGALTPAQREVALLAASGRTNRDIAQQLTVSVRTVENHLQQAYRTLGISRSDLPARLGFLRSE